MKIAIKNFDKIQDWSNPKIANFLHFIYGSIKMNTPVNQQKVRYDEIRRILNEAFVLPNLKDPTGLGQSFIDRYNAVKNYDLDLLAIVNYIDSLQIANKDFVICAKLSAPYKTFITPINNNIPFMLEFTTFGLETLKNAINCYLLYEANSKKI